MTMGAASEELRLAREQFWFVAEVDVVVEFVIAFYLSVRF